MAKVTQPKSSIGRVVIKSIPFQDRTGLQKKRMKNSGERDDGRYKASVKGLTKKERLLLQCQ